MQIDWSHLTFMPDNDTMLELAQAWEWLLGDTFTPLMFSIFGDMFYLNADREVYRLDTGLGEVTRVAENITAFESKLAGPSAQQWFLPALVFKLHEANKIPGPNECYTFEILPVFGENRYTVANLRPVPAGEHFRATGEQHRQLQR